MSDPRDIIAEATVDYCRSVESIVIMDLAKHAADALHAAGHRVIELPEPEHPAGDEWDGCLDHWDIGGGYVSRWEENPGCVEFGVLDMDLGVWPTATIRTLALALLAAAEKAEEAR